ncbi:MAG: VWA domain-containing protein, partial [Planctomycetaceae bacterium]|nr:VWA domain-containing protein [Planctomycetaceae bacterium]
NDTDAVLEVTYIFPISSSAIVTSFTATVGEKIIKGKVKEKEKAKKEYQKAMLDGNSAYMMTNDESNIFKMNIGKIAVGEIVKITIDYIDNFEIIANQMRILIPTLVPPRYYSQITNKLDYSKTEIEYRGNITITFDKELKIEDIESKTHGIKLENNVVTAKNIKLNKDFVLDIQLVDQAFSKGYCHDLPNGNKVVYLSFFPDIEIETQYKPRNYVFVMDVSGSMMGFKLDQTKEAVIKCLKQLKEGDKFNIIPFSNSHKLYSEKLVDYNAENYKKAREFVLSLQAGGGTDMWSVIKKAIHDFTNEKIIFLFTDGQVANESAVAGHVRKSIGKSSLFIFGIDSSVNKKGLQEIAEAGYGKAEFVAVDEMINDKIIRQFARVSSANLFNIVSNCKTNKVIKKIDKVRTFFNHEFYDVLIETDNIADDFELICKTDDNKTYSFVIPQNTLEYSDLPLDKIYAYEQIQLAEKYISNYSNKDNKGYKERVIELAVKYQIDSKYTAFIAVNERDEKLTDIPAIQDTILESPSGWDMMQQNTNVHRNIPGFATGIIVGDEISCHDNVYYDLSPPRGESDEISYNDNVCYRPQFSRIKRGRERVCSINDASSNFRMGFEIDNSFANCDFDVLFAMITECEELINQNADYQTILDEIIDKLWQHFSSPLKEYKKLFKKMKKETPKVYALIEPYLPPQRNIFKRIFNLR